MSEKIKAPFTPEQVAGLNRWQNALATHPFTCDESGCGKRDEAPDGEGRLFAIPLGWVCPCGKYTQTWAHDFMVLSREDFVKMTMGFKP